MQINTRSNVIIPWLLSGLLFLFGIWSTYKIVDQSVTLNHQQQNSETIGQQRDILAYVLSSIGKGQSESLIRQVLQQKKTSSDIFEKGKGEIVADQVSFIFQDGYLIHIKIND